MHPVQYTPASFRAAMLEHKPELAGELDEVLIGLQDDQIEVTRRQTQLATFLQREVSLTQREGAHVFRWHNQHGREVELTLAPSHTSGNGTALPNIERLDTPSWAAQANDTLHHAPSPTGNVFSELAALLDDSTLLITLARVGTHQEEPLLSVNVIPKAINGSDTPTLHPISLTATPSELDDPHEGFTQAIRVALEGRSSIRDAIEELKRATKAEAEAKRAEAKAKQRNTHKHKANAEKAKQDASPLFNHDNAESNPTPETTSDKEASPA